MQVMSDIGLHVAPAPQGVGVSNLQQPASSDGYLSAPKLNSRMDGVVYLNRKTARPERWNQAQKSWTCVCDLVSDSKCSGNKQSNRCLNTGKAVSQSLPFKRDCDVPQVAEALANLGEQKSAPLRASESLGVKSLGFVQGTKQGSQIVITDNGRWEGEVGENLAALPKFTVEVSGCSLPLRPGATFYKQFTGRHAEAVSKLQVTIEFQFGFSTKNPGCPNFTAIDRDNKPFATKFVADSPSALEFQWLTQNTAGDDAGPKLILDGRRFMGIENFTLPQLAKTCG